jgi:hypothetical protein
MLCILLLPLLLFLPQVMPPHSSDAPAAVDSSNRQSSNTKPHNDTVAVAAAGDVTRSSEQRQKNEDAYTKMGHTSDVLCIAWYVHLIT